ncbi:MAG: DUF427 domain-containing protein [Xanthomonadales bacterium]|nr:DUF427 domain-containing protein [Xanthomonadales bacterium]
MTNIEYAVKCAVDPLQLQPSETVNTDAAWYYPKPFTAAREIKGYLAFWRGVEVEE